MKAMSDACGKSTSAIMYGQAGQMQHVCTVVVGVHDKNGVCA
jgi:hypothetical protein